MRKRKIRGHNRRHKQTLSWKNYNLPIRTDLLADYQSDHIDIVVHPWCDMSLINSVFPEPRGKTKIVILNALLDIYDSIEAQLIELGKPFYLAIWLFEPRFSKSQIVYAIDAQKDAYSMPFYASEVKKEINLNHYFSLKTRLEKFEWTHFIDEDHLDNEIVGEVDEYYKKSDYHEMKKWFDKMMRKEHRTFKKDDIEIYSFKKGNVWVGKNNSLQQ